MDALLAAFFVALRVFLAGDKAFVSTPMPTLDEGLFLDDPSAGATDISEFRPGEAKSVPSPAIDLLSNFFISLLEMESSVVPSVSRLGAMLLRRRDVMLAATLLVKLESD